LLELVRDATGMGSRDECGSKQNAELRDSGEEDHRANIVFTRVLPGYA